MRKVGEFLNKHKLLLIGLVLYVVVYIVSKHYPVWVYHDGVRIRAITGTVETTVSLYETDEALDIYMPDILSGNRFMEKIPLDFLFYGIAELAVPVHTGAMFGLCVVTYGMLALGKLLELTKGEKGKFELWLLAYIYGNIIFYPLAFVMKLLEPHATTLIDTLGYAADRDMNIGLKILLVAALFLSLFLLVFGLFLPSGANMFFFFIYLAALKPVKFILSKVGGVLDGSAVKEFIAMLIAVAVLLAFNLLAEKAMEKVQEYSIKPLIGAFKWIKKKIRRESAVQNNGTQQSVTYVSEDAALDNLFANNAGSRTESLTGSL